MQSGSLKSFLRNYMASVFFYDFIFAYAIYTVLFSIRGLSVLEISILIAWWCSVVIVLESPTGALADSWNRRYMLTLAPVIKILCFVCWYFADGNIYLYGLGFFFWSLGSSFLSGTSESLLYDKLAFHNQTDNYERILGRLESLRKMSIAISMITGGFIAHYNIDWAVLFSIVPLLLSTLFASMLRDAPRTEKAAHPGYFEIIRIAFREVKTNRVLLYFIIYMLGVSILYNLEELDQLYYQLAGLPIYAFGIVGFLSAGLAAFSAFHAYRLKGNTHFLYLLPLIISILLFIVARYPGIPIIILLVIAYFVNSPLGVLAESSIQHSIKSMSRATVTSMNSLFLNLFGIILMMAFGLISRIWNLQAIYVAASILLFCFSLWVFIFRGALRHSNKQNDL